VRFPYRMKVYACIHPETYKYFLDPVEVDSVWKELARAFGERREVSSVKTVEIDGTRLLVRAPEGGNPITVIRKRDCTEGDVERFHAVIGFQGNEKGTEKGNEA